MSEDLRTHHIMGELNDAADNRTGFIFDCGIRTDKLDVVFSTSNEWSDVNCKDCLETLSSRVPGDEENTISSEATQDKLNALEHYAFISAQKLTGMREELKMKANLLRNEVFLHATIIDEITRIKVGQIESSKP